MDQEEWLEDIRQQEEIMNLAIERMDKGVDVRS
jgi:hypothetical protein